MKRDTLFTCAQTGRIRNLTQERATEAKRNEALRWAARWHRQNNIAQICHRFELESDEFYTAEQKAEQILQSINR